MEPQSAEEAPGVMPLGRWDSRSECFCALSHRFLWTLPVSLSYLCLVSSSPGAGIAWGM